MEKVITIKHNIVTGEVSYSTGEGDEFGNVEMLGVLETVKTLVINDIIENSIE